MKIIEWETISDKNKSYLKNLKPIFILGGVRTTEKRLSFLVKNLIKQNKNVLIGVLKDKFINGFEGQEQFETQSFEDTKKIINKLETDFNKKITILFYFQRNTKYILKDIDPSFVLIFNSSFKYAFHFTEIFYTLIKQKINYKLISPFFDKNEALEFDKYYKNILAKKAKKIQSFYGKDKKDIDIKKLLLLEQSLSFDHTFQTSLLFFQQNKLIISAHNTIIPFSTHARHFGFLKEKNYSPPQDLNFYNTNHAEVNLLLKALENKFPLKNGEIYINLLPCPFCSRMLCKTGIKKVNFLYDHSNQYAQDLFKNCKIKIEKI